MTRKKIEQLWIDRNVFRSGMSLSAFLGNVVNSSDLTNQWCNIWRTQKLRLIDDCYFNNYIDNNISIDDYADLCYLLRSLSLNMLLDDNMEVV